jgi:hypothetical protein
VRVRGALLVGALVVVSGCAAPDYHYIGQSGSDLVLRVPRAWAPMYTDEVLEASGVDPAAFSGWAVFYDGSAEPDPLHVQLESTEAPLLLARTVEVPEDERDGVTLAGLRENLLPSEPTQREAATKAGTFTLITDETIDDERGTGAHVVYSYRVSAGTEFVDQIALTNSEHTSISLVYVHCDEQCYRQRADEISAAVTSLTLKNL